MFYGRVLSDRGYCVAELGPYLYINVLVEDLMERVGDDWKPDYEMTVWMLHEDEV